MDRRGPGDGPDEPPTLEEAIDLDDYKTLVVHCRRVGATRKGRLRLQPAEVLEDDAFEDVEPWPASSGRGLYSKSPPTED